MSDWLIKPQICWFLVKTSSDGVHLLPGRGRRCPPLAWQGTRLSSRGGPSYVQRGSYLHWCICCISFVLDFVHTRFAVPLFNHDLLIICLLLVITYLFANLNSTSTADSEMGKKYLLCRCLMDGTHGLGTTLGGPFGAFSVPTTIS